MKINPPFPLSTISQPFGANAVSYYANNGLKGHPGIDFGVSYGTPIKSTVDSLCSSVACKGNPNLMAYHAVYTIVDDVNCSYEVSYGHCSEIYATPDTKTPVGAILGLVGNTGDVWANGVEVTNAEKLAGSHAGSHLHLQVRVLQKEAVSVPVDPTKHYINDGSGMLVLNGARYYVPDWGNGYNGCVDPAQFFDTEQPTALEPSDRLMVVGNQMTSSNSVQARIVLAVANFLRAFGS